MASPRLVHDEYERGCALSTGSPPVRYPGPAGFLSSHLPTAALALGSVGALAAAVNRLLESRGRDRLPWLLDPERVAASFGSEQLMRIDGARVSGFAPMSGFFAASDGWVRTHANYPHHRSRLLAALDLAGDADPGMLSTRIGELPAQEVEDRCAAANGVAARVRSEAEWAVHPQGVVSAAGPLVSSVVTSQEFDGPVLSVADPARPLAGLRVLDLSRVLAGPVAARDLALLGAQVLRVDPPHLHEIDWQHRETGQGKRSTLLDLTATEDAATMRSLVSTADVVVTGYRPGSMDRFELTGRPGSVHASVSAWGVTGPWAGRRGFDSLVQAASGIALVEGGSHPGALPVQVLDHASGHLLAAAIVDALALRVGDGCGRAVSVSLARTARTLLNLPGRTERPAKPLPPGPSTVVAHGAVTTARPVLPGHPEYPYPAHDWGADAPHWI